ncbi:site-specific integrase [Mangrovimonas sp. TPBH4]|uniref:site-specific integrase n=1 Tax=Mangrovimonas sp. TPBH4 TaxID=1645914 RepID=UPI0006B5D792|nr:site-specific integrase [Mangrovimonas sp. TPBH4]
MKQQTMTVLFYLNKAKTNQKGICPIYCRITYLKKRQQFSTGQFVNPEYWNTKEQKVSQEDLNYKVVNAQLLIIRQKLEKDFLSLQLKGLDFTVTDISDIYFNKPTKKEDGVVSFYKRYLSKIQKLVGKDLKDVTFKKFEYVHGHLESFVKHKYKMNDIPLRNLDLNFLTEFEYYLKTVKGHKQVTLNKVIQRFRNPIKIAIAEGFLEVDPFILYKAKRAKKEVVFLSPEELKKLEKHRFVQPRLKLIKDLFIFSCYTGLAYHELSNLTSGNIIKGFDGNLWIQMQREKTSKEFQVPLLPKAISIINGYNAESSLIFPRISNQKYNSYLKEVAEIVGIDKKLTTHTARKTFASTVLLYNDVPMEIVSELLGHSSMKITQDSYGKVVQKKVAMEMEKLSSKIGR